MNEVLASEKTKEQAGRGNWPSQTSNQRFQVSAQSIKRFKAVMTTILMCEKEFSSSKDFSSLSDKLLVVQVEQEKPILW